jgi:hypothetical protein
MSWGLNFWVFGFLSGASQRKIKHLAHPLIQPAEPAIINKGGFIFPGAWRGLSLANKFASANKIAARRRALCAAA